VRKPRVYVDKSVFGGTADEEFAVASRRLFDRVCRGEFVVLVSQISLDELTDGPHGVQQILRDLPHGRLVEVPADQKAMALAQAYVDAGILSTSRLADAIHVATATIARADLMLSWNFRHIVNYDRIHKYNGVNTLKSYPPVEIHSPLEVTKDD
jgi:hypothetical protein